MTSLVVRPWRLDDAESLLVACGSDDIELPGGPLRTMEQAEQWIADLSVAQAVGRAQSWAITVDDLPVGGVALRRIDHAHQSAEISYWLAEFTRGLGLAARATAAVAAYGFNEGQLFRIELAFRATHPKSRAVAERVGFTAEGIHRAKMLLEGERVNVETYARLASDPPPDIEPLGLR
ncbi:MAG: GNAT family N-acetyltransferase [Ornithinimicrobium sp.]